MKRLSTASVALIFTALLSSSVAGAEAAPGRKYNGYIFSKELIKTLILPDETFTKTRPKLEFMSGATVETCLEYYGAIADDHILDTDANHFVSSSYRECAEITSMFDAIAHDGYRPESFGKELFNRLDLRSVRSSQNNMLEDGQNTLASLGEAGSFTVSALGVEKDTEDWHFKLVVLADADLDQNGEPDWIMFLSDEAKKGSYRGYSTIIIYNAKPDGLLTAMTMR